MARTRAPDLRKAVTMALWLMCCLPFPAYAGIQIDGVFERTVYTIDGRIDREEKYEFSVKWQESNWWIQVVLPDGAISQTGGDGDVTAALLQSDIVYSFDGKQPITDPETLARLSDSGAIGAFPYTITDYPYPLIPWFVYCSGSVLSEGKNDRMCTPWCSARMPIGRIFDLYVKMKDPGGVFIEAVDFIVTDNLLERLQSYPWLTPEEQSGPYAVDLQDAFRPGFVGGTLQIESYNRLAGYDVPAAFVLTRYEPLGTDAGTTPRLAEVYKGDAREMKVIDSFDWLPRSSKNISVADFRFQNHELGIPSYTYTITNSQWQTQITPEMTAAFRKIEEDLRRNPPFEVGNETHPLVMLLFLLLFSSFPVLLYLRYRSKPAQSA